MKRALENAQPTNFKERKKQKLAEARTIAVQSPPATSKTTAAGPSRLPNDKLKPIPGAIDVEKFAEARAFEINALKSAIQTTKWDTHHALLPESNYEPFRSASTTRAWQVLPRHLRRRAASHNPRRVPLRLRDKARAEMDPVRKKALGRTLPKLGKKRRPPLDVKFLKRQRNKRWLETHIWHAKRMKMEDMWGYRLAVTPTEKAFRPSHRASIHGSILHDASYQSLVELKGPEATLRSVLEVCCDPQLPSPGAPRFTLGVRVANTFIYEPKAYPYCLICPIIVMWRARLSHTATLGSKKGKGKGKEKQAQPNPPNDLRTVWIRFHPSVYSEVFSALRSSISQVLEDTSAGNSIVDVQLTDIRGEVGIFEIMGPQSSQILRGALSPVMANAGDEFKKFWGLLRNLQSSGSVPTDMIAGFTVNDPRLKFPPKNAKVELPTGDIISSSMPVAPSANLAVCNLWDQNIRNSLKNPRYQTKEINERRSKNLVPGTFLNPLRTDDRIPVMLIQTSVEDRDFKDTEGIHGWTLIFPAGWCMSFLQQLTFTGTRVAGQREHKTQGFEAGTTYFPSDFPSVEAYDTYAATKAEKDEAKWTRTPPAKRVNYAKIGTRSPWKPDWEVVLGLKMPPSEPAITDEESAPDLVPTQRENNHQEESTTEDVAHHNRAWLLRGPEVRSMISDLRRDLYPGQQLLTIVNNLRAKRSQPLLGDTIKADDLLRSALVSVHISICSKGCPDDLSMIYSMPDAELQEWRKGLIKVVHDPAAGEVEFLNLPDIVPSPDSIIGYITTGGFSLSRGEGFAIGAVTLTSLLELEKQVKRVSNYAKDSIFVKVRSRKGRHCRLARLEVVQN
ncbi:hypothetical protein D9757_003446 [Collybiopsis confluens]|uniref:Uncharacterized protein n=1 Tax=Collybiopsis confluens TaxID=2823264 RepID=A0A8H5HU27_9AGAR|nr:hypothetical protein D9757_003446 [Collybiopsis confluens]